MRVVRAAPRPPTPKQEIPRPPRAPPAALVKRRAHTRYKWKNSAAAMLPFFAMAAGKGKTVHLPCAVQNDPNRGLEVRPEVCACAWGRCWVR